MDESLLAKIKKSCAEFQIERLNPLRLFNMSANSPDGTKTVITENRAVTLDSQLYTCDDLALVLLCLRWRVTS